MARIDYHSHTLIRDGRRRLLRNLNIRGNNIKYILDPVEEGWCGYDSAAYMVTLKKDFGNSGGRVIRFSLKNCLKKYNSEWMEFFGRERYLAAERRLNMIPDSTSDWQYHTDLLWITSIAYSLSFTYHSEWEQQFFHKRGTLLVRHPSSTYTSPIMMYAFRDHMYGVHFVRNNSPIEISFDDDQLNFERVFKKICK